MLVHEIFDTRKNNIVLEFLLTIEQVYIPAIVLTFYYSHANCILFTLVYHGFYWGFVCL